MSIFAVSYADVDFKHTIPVHADSKFQAYDRINSVLEEARPKAVITKVVRMEATADAIENMKGLSNADFSESGKA